MKSLERWCRSEAIEELGGKLESPNSGKVRQTLHQMLNQAAAIVELTCCETLDVREFLRVTRWTKQFVRPEF